MYWSPKRRSGVFNTEASINCPELEIHQPISLSDLFTRHLSIKLSDFAQGMNLYVIKIRMIDLFWINLLIFVWERCNMFRILPAKTYMSAIILPIKDSYSVYKSFPLYFFHLNLGRKFKSLIFLQLNMSSDTDIVLGPSSRLLSLNFATYQDYHFPPKKKKHVACWIMFYYYYSRSKL